MKQFVDVILPLPIPRFFTYSVEDCRVKVGHRVIVPFGTKKFYTAIVYAIHDNEPIEYTVKPIFSLLDEFPIVNARQLNFWVWLAKYYMSAIGDIYKAALPSGLKLESETRVELNADFSVHPEELSDKELLVLKQLSDEPIQYLTKLARETKIVNILPVANRLIERGAIALKEELVDSYKPKIETCIRLSEEYGSDLSKVDTLLNSLTNAPKQLDLVMKYLELSNLLQGKGELKEVYKRDLLSKASASYSSLKGLFDKGIMEEYGLEVGRLNSLILNQEDAHPLNDDQDKAFDEVLNRFKVKDVVLLHGVTSSGKTELYIHLIERALKEGKQVLYLVPEIALTTQITSRLQRVLGDRLGVYHSKFPDSERVEIWKKQLSDNPYQVILGVRSSIFLPFQNLGLVIVDEEHETTYKQQDPAPRYHARDAAIVLAKQFGGKVLLGTATPSIESWYNMNQGKYALVSLNKRYKSIALPEVIAVDIHELKRKKRMKGQFSPLLLGLVKEALDNEEQVILFQNRRGFAPIMECNVCGWVPKCLNCDVSLTFHKHLNELTCHYCGHTQPVALKCPACDSTDLFYRGFGTEKVEEEIKLIFPQAKIARMDLDTTRARKSYETIINDFQEKRTNILIGTQMVSKGLDFDGVSVVGILNADTMLNYPDFRSYERAYQMMAQVAGRAGRHGKQGKVILQTRSIDHPIIAQIIHNRYEEMVDNQLEERQLFYYPPFCRLIYVYLKHRDEVRLNAVTHYMAERLKAIFGDRVLGPDKPPVGRVQTYYIKKIILKVERSVSMDQVKDILSLEKDNILAHRDYKSVLMYYDVDPI